MSSKHTNLDTASDGELPVSPSAHLLRRKKLLNEKPLAGLQVSGILSTEEEPYPESTDNGSLAALAPLMRFDLKLLSREKFQFPSELLRCESGVEGFSRKVRWKSRNKAGDCAHFMVLIPSFWRDHTLFPFLFCRSWKGYFIVQSELRFLL